MDPKTEAEARQSYANFRKNPIVNVLGIVVAIGLGILGLFGNVQYMCCSLGYLLIALILFYIPKFFGVDKIKYLACLGVIFVLIATLFGAFVVSKPFVNANNHVSEYNSEGFSGVTIAYADGQADVTVTYSGGALAANQVLNLEFHPVNMVSYQSYKYVPGSNNEYRHAMTLTGGSTYTVHLDSVGTQYIYAYSFNIEEITSTTESKIVKSSAYSLYTGNVDDGTLTKICIIGTGISGNAYNAGLVGILYYLMLIFTTLSEKRLEKTRAKMEADGRLYPQGYGRCKECGALVLPGETICRKCGAYIDVPDDLKAKKYDYVQCSECGKEIPENANVCPYCGVKFDEEEEVVEVESRTKAQAKAGTVQCSECGKEIPEDANVCPYCGVKFDEEDEVVEVEKK